MLMLILVENDIEKTIAKHDLHYYLLRNNLINYK